MNKVNMQIWGRDFELDVKYDCYSGEEILDSQKSALEAFLELKDRIQASLKPVKDYCLEHYRKEIGADVIDNIFKYVVPKYLYVIREEDKHVVAIMCNDRFEPEHGLAVVFEDEEFRKIGGQDMVL